MISQELIEARNVALQLELAIAGGLKRGIIDDGKFGASLEDLASDVAERLQALEFAAKLADR